MHPMHNVAMPRPPDAEHLLTLLAVAEAGNESAAAELLGVGQSSVSRRLAALQRLAKEPLTQRAVTGTRLTPAGEALLAPARDVRAALRAAADLLSPDPAAPPRMRCGVCSHLVPRLVGALSASSEAAIEVVEGSSAQLVAAVRRGDLAAAVTLHAPAGGEPGLHKARLGEERIVVVAHPSQASLARGEPGAAGLRDLPWLLPAPPSVVGEAALAHLRRNGVLSRGVPDHHELPSPAAMRSALLAGAGVGVALASELEAEVAAGWLVRAPLPFAGDGEDRLTVWLVTGADLGERRALLQSIAERALRG